MGVRLTREQKDRYLVCADKYIFRELGARLLSMSLLAIFARLLTASLVDKLLGPPILVLGLELGSSLLSAHGRKYLHKVAGDSIGNYVM